MGLDNLVIPKEDGTSALATLGVPVLSRDNPATMDHFREVYDSHNKEIAEGPNLNKPYAEYWTRPFEVVVDEMLSSKDPCYLPDMLGDNIPEELKGSRGSFLTSSLISFRGKWVQYQEGLPDDIEAMLFEEHDPESAAKMADRLLEWGKENNNEAATKMGKWVAFWAERGHGIHPWY